MEKAGILPGSLTTVDLLNYLIPGATILVSLYLLNLLGNFSHIFIPATREYSPFINFIIILFVSYILGHIFHYPAVVVGKFIIKIKGDPTTILIEKGAFDFFDQKLVYKQKDEKEIYTQKKYLGKDCRVLENFF